MLKYKLKKKKFIYKMTKNNSKNLLKYIDFEYVL